MRAPTALLALALLVAGAGFHAVARGEDEPVVDGQTWQEERIRLLETRVRYLMSREEALTNYLMRNEERSVLLAQTARESRREGFTMGAIPTNSREILLAGIERLAANLGEHLPRLTEKEAALARQAAQIGERLGR